MSSSAGKDALAQGAATVLRRARGRPRLEDVAEIESRLLGAALKEFVSCGYAGASMRGIAKAAELSRSTLLSRFPSKAELFEAIMTRQIAQLSAVTTLRSPRDRNDLEQDLEAYANRALEFSLEGELLSVNRLILSESHRFPELGQTAQRSTQLGVEQISEFLRQCVASGDIECADPEGTAEAFILMIRGWYLNVMVTNRMVTAAERRGWVARAVHSLNLGTKPTA